MKILNFLADTSLFIWFAASLLLLCDETDRPTAVFVTLKVLALASLILSGWAVIRFDEFKKYDNGNGKDNH